MRNIIIYDRRDIVAEKFRLFSIYDPYWKKKMAIWAIRDMIKRHKL